MFAGGAMLPENLQQPVTGRERRASETVISHFIEPKMNEEFKSSFTYNPKKRNQVLQQTQNPARKQQNDNDNETCVTFKSINQAELKINVGNNKIETENYVSSRPNLSSRAISKKRSSGQFEGENSQIEGKYGRQRNDSTYERDPTDVSP